MGFFAATATDEGELLKRIKFDSSEDTGITYVGGASPEVETSSGRRVLDCTGGKYLTIDNFESTLGAQIASTGKMTVSFWFKADTGQNLSLNEFQCLWGKSPYRNTNMLILDTRQHWGAQYRLNPGLYALYTASNGFTLSAGGIPLGTGSPNPGYGAWHHISMVYTGTDIEIYIDGNLAASNFENGATPSSISAVMANGVAFAVGHNPAYSGTVSFKGKISDFHLHNKALAQSEVQTVMNSYEQVATVALTESNDGTDTTLGVTLTDPGSSAAGWAYRVGTPLGATGQPHGGTFQTGTSVIITGLSSALHTIYVAPVDANGDVVGPSATIQSDLRDISAIILSDLNRYYHFNGDLLDASGNGNSATMAVGTATYDVDKWNQKAFVGADNRLVDLGHPMITSTRTYSISLWVYSDSELTCGLMDNGIYYQTWGPGGIAVNFGSTTNATGFYYRYNNSNVTPYQCAIPGLSTGAWHHIVAVQNGSTMQTWVDGVKATEITNAVNAVNFTVNNMRLGGVQSNHGSYGGWFNEAVGVKMDEVAYWTKSLSQAEIEWMWNSGTGRHIITADSTIDASVVVTGDTVDITATIGDPGSNAAGGWAYSTSPLGAVGAAHGGTAVPSGTTAQMTGVADGVYTLYYGLIDGSGNIVVKGSTTYGVGLTVGLILQHNCEDTTADVGSANVTLTGASLATVDSRTAWSYPSVSSIALVPSSNPSLAGDWTFSMWFKGLKPGGSYWRTAMKAPNDHPVIIEWNSNNLGGYQSGPGFHDCGFDMNPADYTGWHMITAVGSGATTTYYVDGASVGSIPWKSSQTLAAIGASNATTHNQAFADYVDDVRVWSRALSASEVSTLHSTTQLITDGLVAKYALDFDAADSVGSNNLTTNGTVGHATNGSDKYADFTKIGYLQSSATVDLTGKSSVSFWAKIDTTYTYSGHTYAYMFQWGTSPGSYFNLFVLDGKIRTQHNTGGGWIDNRGNTAVPAGWNHFIITLDPDTNEKKVYLNGVADTWNASYNGGFTGTFSSAQDIYLGYGGGDPNFNHDGGIDDVRIWNRVLSASEISTLYSAGAEDAQSITDGLVAKYALDFDAKDSVGSNDGTISGATFSLAGTKKEVNFDGSNDYIQIPHDASNSFGTGDFAISMWINPDVVSPGVNYSGMLWSKHYTNLELFIYQGQVSSYFGGAGHNCNGNTPIVVGQWQHLVLTRNGSDVRLYIDGVDNSSTYGDPGSQNVSSTSNDIFLGYRNGLSSTFYNGAMDDVRQWNRGLSASEASSLHSAGREDGISLTDDLIGAWNFDSGNANDSAGSDNGTASNVTFATAGGRTYADFSGSNSKITLSNDPFTASNATFTMSMWVKHDSLSGSRRYMSWGSSGGRFFFGYNSSANRVDLGMGGSTTIASSATYRPTVGEWALWTVSNSGTTTKFYKNGQLVSTVSHGNTGAINSGQTVRIGAQYHGTENFDGQMDDVRIWSRVLNDSEVADLYLTTFPLATGLAGYWPLNGNANDSLGTYNGTEYGTVTYQGGKFGNSAGMSSATAGNYIDVGMSSVSFTAGFTISGWFKNTPGWASSAPYGVQELISKDGVDNTREWKSYIQSGVIGSACYNLNGARRIARTAPAPSDGVWYHACFTYGGGTSSNSIKIYINGVQVDNADDNLGPYPGMTAPTNPVRFGQYAHSPPMPAGQSLRFNGEMDDIATWTRELTATEVLAIYNAGNSGNDLSTLI